MREIKFRAWDDLNKKWLLGYEYPNLGGFSMMGEVMAFGEYSGMLNSFSLEDWDKIILMQYTGLKDKKGKEIYEGDVIKVNEHSGLIRDIRSDIVFYDLWDETNIIEVIGNIHENPELMPKDKKLVKK